MEAIKHISKGFYEDRMKKGCIENAVGNAELESPGNHGKYRWLIFIYYKEVYKNVSK